MQLTQIAPDYWVGPQVSVSDVAEAKAQGYTAIVCNRPDGEEAGQPTAAEIEAACKEAGLTFLSLPMQGPNYTQDMAQQLKSLLDGEEKVIGYCRSGNRANVLYQAAKAL
ncbi:MAG: protein tyrosine phosphatase family protein [Saccharospirillum sp.]